MSVVWLMKWEEFVELANCLHIKLVNQRFFHRSQLAQDNNGMDLHKIRQHLSWWLMKAAKCVWYPPPSAFEELIDPFFCARQFFPHFGMLFRETVYFWMGRILFSAFWFFLDSIGIESFWFRSLLSMRFQIVDKTFTLENQLFFRP